MSTAKLKRGLVAAIVVPLAFLLSSCDLKMQLDVKADGTATVVVDLSETDLSRRGLREGMSCNELFAEFNISAEMAQAKLEDLSTGSTLHCRMSSLAPEQMSTTSPEDMSGDVGFIDNGDTITVILPERAKAQTIENMDEFFTDSRVSLVVNMPGPITEATGNGTFSGNTYKIENGKFSDVAHEIRITSKKSGASQGSIFSGSTSSDSSSSGSTVGRILILVVLAALIAIVVFFVYKRKKKKASALRPGGLMPGVPGGWQPPGGWAMPPGVGVPQQQPYPAQPQPGWQQPGGWQPQPGPGWQPHSSGAVPQRPQQYPAQPQPGWQPPGGWQPQSGGGAPQQSQRYAPQPPSGAIPQRPQTSPANSQWEPRPDRDGPIEPVLRPKTDDDGDPNPPRV